MPDMSTNKTVKEENLKLPESGETWRLDGPTVEEWVAAGYSAFNYPVTGYKSKSSPEEIEAAQQAEREGKSPPKVKTAINKEMPDIQSQNDVALLKAGTRFLARFIVDPKGDTGRQARENIVALRSGKMIRHGIGVDYWTNHYLDRPPIAISEGNGKYRVLE